MDQDSTQLKRELKLDANMIKTMIFSLLLLWCIQSKANIISHEYVINNKQPSFLLAETDSSNYKIKILKKEINYSQIRFIIVDEKNNPLDGVISLIDLNKKGISGILTNEDGKILVMVYSDVVRSIIVGRIGFGNVIIPIEKVKNTVAEIRVQLYPFTTTN